MRKLLTISVFLMLIFMLLAAKLPIGAAPASVCGNNKKESGEDCDGIDDFACPDLCTPQCTCPPPESRALTNPFRYTFAYDILAGNTIKTFDLQQDELGFQGITFAFKNTVKNVKFYLDANVSAPSRLPEGQVYQYFRIFLENSSQKQELAFAHIYFKVPTSWLISNNIQSVSLQIAHTPWEPVYVSKIRQDTDYAYFVGLADDLGLFAIVGYAPETPIEKPVCGNGVVESGETSETCCADAGCPAGLSCISNKCQEAAICGNNKCESGETAQTCPIDCARSFFAEESSTFLVLLTAALVGALIFFGRKTFRTPTKKKEHAGFVSR